jgi:hypothetical protein
LPLSIFASYAFSADLTNPGTWSKAFILGSVFALLRSVVFRVLNQSLNSLVLGTDLYLYLGMIVSLSDSSDLTHWMATLKESLVFGCICFATLIGTLKRDSRTVSFSMLMANVIAFFWSLQFQGRHWISVILPVILLSFLHKWIQSRNLKEQESNG